jgi:RNA polymerase sigma-70 factor (ECF subfamily)
MADAMAKTAKIQNYDELVVRARTDGSALGKLYEFYYGRIFRFCVHRLFCRTAAEDVTSMVFLEAARKIRDFAGSTEADFSRWIYAIATNKANSYFRKTSRRKKIMEKIAAVRGSDCDDEGKNCVYDWAEVYAAVMKLSNKERTIITLRFFEKLGFDAIAQILDSRPPAVRVALHRSLKKLRKELEADSFGEV